MVGEVVRSTGHGSDEDTDRMRLGQRREELGETDRRRVTGEGELDRVRRQVVGDGVLDDTEKLLRALDTTNAELVEKLDCACQLRRLSANSPMRPEKRLNVLGILTLGLTSMRTPLAV